MKPKMLNLKLGPVFPNWYMLGFPHSFTSDPCMECLSDRAILCCHISLLINKYNLKWFSFDWFSYFYFLLWGGKIIQLLFLLLFSKQAFQNLYIQMRVVPFKIITLGSCLLTPAMLPLLRTFLGNSSFKLSLEAAVLF